jgi:exopolysaccharide production protein ExoZ
MKLGSIQMLRALAALIVVYMHSAIDMRFFATGWRLQTALLLNLGIFGVDIFFVISGFVIYTSSARLNGRSQALDFLWYRFRRINPVYYAATLITLLVWLPSFLRHTHPLLTRSSILESLILLPIAGSAGTILEQAWTLTLEWYFYLIFFLLILFRSQQKGAIISVVLGILIIIGYFLPDMSVGPLDLHANPLLFEFLLGIFVGYAWRRWTPTKKTACILLSLGILFGLALTLTGFYNYLEKPLPASRTLRYLHAPSWGGAAALIVAGCVFLEKTGTTTFFRKHRLLLLLGDASYSLYLFHYIILGAIGAVYTRLGLFLPPDVAIPINAVIAVVGCLLFYKWVELPLLKLFKKERPFRPIPSANILL